MQDLLKYLDIPGATFLTGPKVDFLQNVLNSFGFRVFDTKYAVIATHPDIKELEELANVRNKVVFMSHIDHPGVVFEPSLGGIYTRLGLGFGSLYLPKVLAYYLGEDVPTDIGAIGAKTSNKMQYFRSKSMQAPAPVLNLFSFTGKLVAKAQVVGYKHPKVFYRLVKVLDKNLAKSINLKKRQHLTILDWLKIKKLYKKPVLFGQWDVGKAKIQDELIYGPALDNDIVTVLILNVIKQALTGHKNVKGATPERRKTSKNKQANAARLQQFHLPSNIVLVFTKFEEVFQISSYNLAHTNLLHITEQDMVINLESMKVNKEVPNPADYTDFSKQPDGPVVSFCEKNLNYTLLWQQKHKIASSAPVTTAPTPAPHTTPAQTQTQNKAYEFLINVAKKHALPVKFGCASGSTDAKFFAYFGRTPHIVTLNLPNPNKHNVNAQGRIVAETVKLAHYNTARELLVGLVNSLMQNQPTAEQPQPLQPPEQIAPSTRSSSAHSTETPHSTATPRSTTPSQQTYYDNVPKPTAYTHITDPDFLRHKAKVAKRISKALACHTNQNFLYNSPQCVINRVVSYVWWVW